MTDFQRPCQKCERVFFENELEYSHDYPKYLGGTDSDGRHLLCRECHTHYDYCVLKEIFDKLYDLQIPYYLDRRNLIPLQMKLIKDGRKNEYFIIINKVKEVFFE